MSGIKVTIGPCPHEHWSVPGTTGTITCFDCGFSKLSYEPTFSATQPSNATVPARHIYEGNGGWKDGRLGQAYDLIAAAIEERGQKSFAHPLLSKIEEFDGEEA